MDRTTLGNRPATLQPRMKIEDFIADGHHVRVSLKLVERQATDLSVIPSLMISAQAFEVNADGYNITGPDGRPSRTPESMHSVIATSLGDTHTLNPGWVRIVGDYDNETFEQSAVFANGKPAGEPDWETNPTGQHFDTFTGVGYRWAEGETLTVARGKVEEMLNIIRNSAPLAGIDF